MRTNRLPLAAAVLLGLLAVMLWPYTTSAHHTNVSCADRATATWSIGNSEPRPMTYTTDAGHTGAIGPRGTVTVEHEGTSLTVYGVWDNGQRNTSTGFGNCIPESTTTTSSTTTTVPPTSTTTTIVEPEPTVTSTPTDTTPATTTTLPAPGECATTPDGETVCVNTTVPDTTTPVTDPPPVVPNTCLLFDPNDRSTYTGEQLPAGEWVGAGSWDDADGTHAISGMWCKRIAAGVGEPVPATPTGTAAPQLPATGAYTTTIALAALAVIVTGVSLLAGRRVDRRVREGGPNFEANTRTEGDQ